MAIKFSRAIRNKKSNDKGGALDVNCSVSGHCRSDQKWQAVVQLAARQMLLASGIREARLSVALLSGAEIRRVNREHLGHDYVTDVVTFNLNTEAQGTRHKAQEKRYKTRLSSCALCPEPLALPAAAGQDRACALNGEICICPAEARRNARRFGEPFQRELLRYVAHGILHLLGYDDATAEQREIMRRKEEELLAAIKAKS